MAVSVEASACVVIGPSCLEGGVFDSHFRPGGFFRFNSRPVMYGAIGSLASSRVLGPSIFVPARAAEFNRVHELYLAKLSIPLGSVNRYRQFVGIHSTLRSVKGGEVSG